MGRQVYMGKKRGDLEDSLQNFYPVRGHVFSVGLVVRIKHMGSGCNELLGKMSWLLALAHTLYPLYRI